MYKKSDGFFVVARSIMIGNREERSRHYLGRSQLFGCRLGLGLQFYLVFTICHLLAPMSAFSSGTSSEQLYNRARADYQAAISLPSKDKKINVFRKCFDKVQQVVREDTQERLKDKCLYLTGEIYQSMYEISRKSSYFKAAIDCYRKVAETCRSSNLADDAQYRVGILYLSRDPSQAYIEFKKVLMFFPKSDMRQGAEERVAELEKQLGCGRSNRKVGSQCSLAASAEGKHPKSRQVAGCPSLPELRRIQCSRSNGFTRIVLHVSAPVRFQEHAVQADLNKGSPARVYVDLQDCVATSNLSSGKIPSDAVVQEVNVVKDQPAQTRIAIQSGAIANYRVFSQSNPFRVIVDIRGADPPAGRPSISVKKHDTMPNASLPSLARQLSLDVRRIVIDPGHGGRDKGATGPSNIHEKDITLAVARELKKILENNGCEVFLTRTRDRYVSLEDRTAMSNARKADLFISIHTNAHVDRGLCGTETYFLNFSKDSESARVATMENALSNKRISDLEGILRDLMLNTKMKESVQLANEVQDSIIRYLKEQHYDNVRDRGTKQAPFCVLLGAEMPSVLIETAFISNDREEGRLKDRNFQVALAKGIAAGVGAYSQQIKKLALSGVLK